MDIQEIECLEHRLKQVNHCLYKDVLCACSVIIDNFSQAQDTDVVFVMSAFRTNSVYEFTLKDFKECEVLDLYSLLIKDFVFKPYFIAKVPVVPALSTNQITDDIISQYMK